MFQLNSQKFSAQRLEPFLDLIAFATTLLIATRERWSVTDMVWSFWLSSLVLGYVYLFFTTLIPARGAAGTSRGFSFNPFASLSKLLFFSFHFLFFHFVHGIFLSMFFPMGGFMGGGLGLRLPGGFSPNFSAMDSIMDQGPLNGFLTMLVGALRRYWPFLLTSSISHIESYSAALQTPQADTMLPYQRVMRMHFFIILFAFLSTAGFQHYALYLLLIFYFFPLDSLRQLLDRFNPASAEHSV